MASCVVRGELGWRTLEGGEDVEVCGEGAEDG